MVGWNPVYSLVVMSRAHPDGGAREIQHLRIIEMVAGCHTSSLEKPRASARPKWELRRRVTSASRFTLGTRPLLSSSVPSMSMESRRITGHAVRWDTGRAPR